MNVLDIIYLLAGERIRTTAPNGFRNVGHITTRKVGVHDVAFMDGYIAGGEYLPTARIEIKVGRRYREVWSNGEPTRPAWGA